MIRGFETVLIFKKERKIGHPKRGLVWIGEEKVSAKVRPPSKFVSLERGKKRELLPKKPVVGQEG